MTNATARLARMSSPIPLCIPEFGGNDAAYVLECIETGWVSSAGPFVDRFEVQVAEHVGAKAAVATSSGTAALHVALLVAGVRPDDEVPVSALSFIAPANAIRYVGAWPVFIDAEGDYCQMDGRRVGEFLERSCDWSDGALRNRQTGRRVGAIVPVHLLGHPVDIDPIAEIARRYSIPVIEDATESLGALYHGRAVGTLADIACFSFNGNKMITSGGGGMIVTENRTWANRARYLTTQAQDDGSEGVHGEIGFNYRLSNLHAALGCSQLERLASHLEAKRAVADLYTSALREIPGLEAPREASWARSAFWMYTIRVDPAGYGLDSRGLMNELQLRGIDTRPLWQPLQRSPAYASIAHDRCPVAEGLNRTSLSLPCSVSLGRDQERVIEALRALRRERRAEPGFAHLRSQPTYR